MSLSKTVLSQTPRKTSLAAITIFLWLFLVLFVYAGRDYSKALNPREALFSLEAARNNKKKLLKMLNNYRLDYAANNEGFSDAGNVYSIRSIGQV